MNLNKVLLNVVVAAAVSAVTAAGTSYLLFRYATPSGKAQTSSTAPISPEQARVEQIMRDYLTKNPEILVEMTTELDKRQAVQQAEQQQKTISENAAALFHSPVSHTAGNPDGDVTVVEFFDYNCGYCRRALTDVVKLTNDDGKVRLVLKEWPILGEVSKFGARMALAAKYQDKYMAAHEAMIGVSSKLTEPRIRELLAGAGIDMDRLNRDATTNAKAIDTILARNHDQAMAFGFKGTPSFIVGKFRVPGILTMAEFEMVIADARKAKKTN